jgi:hypothetical protein
LRLFSGLMPSFIIQNFPRQIRLARFPDRHNSPTVAIVRRWNGYLDCDNTFDDVTFMSLGNSSGQVKIHSSRILNAIPRIKLAFYMGYDAAGMCPTTPYLGQ